jgi:hypothetical protein
MLSRWIGAVLLIGGIVYFLFVDPLIGVVACLVGAAIIWLGPRAA